MLMIVISSHFNDLLEPVVFHETSSSESVSPILATEYNSFNKVISSLPKKVTKIK